MKGHLCSMWIIIWTGNWNSWKAFIKVCSFPDVRILCHILHTFPMFVQTSFSALKHVSQGGSCGASSRILTTYRPLLPWGPWLVPDQWSFPYSRHSQLSCPNKGKTTVIKTKASWKKKDFVCVYREKKTDSILPFVHKKDIIPSNISSGEAIVLLTCQNTFTSVCCAWT